MRRKTIREGQHRTTSAPHPLGCLGRAGRWWGLGALALCLLGASNSASAQERAYNLDYLRPQLGPSGFLLAPTARVAEAHDYGLELAGLGALAPLVASVPPPDRAVVRHRVMAELGFWYVLAERLQLALAVPMVAHQWRGGRDIGDGVGRLASVALMDPRLSLRASLWGAPDVSGQALDGPALALESEMTLPLGSARNLAGERATSIHSRLVGDFHLLQMGVSFGTGLRHRVRAAELVGTSFRDEWTLHGALKMPLPFFPAASSVIEWHSALAIDALGDSDLATHDLLLGMRYVADGWTLGAAVGRGFTSRPGSPVLRGLVTLSYRPAKKDADDDGVPDARDECPFLPEDRDGFEDDDGCLDPDNDGDMIIDKDDLCPNEAAEEFRDEDEDGCTDPE